MKQRGGGKGSRAPQSVLHDIIIKNFDFHPIRAITLGLPNAVPELGDWTQLSTSGTSQ